MTTETTYPELSKIVVLCGAGCGGTTLMLDMLRAHPRVFAPFELGWMLADRLDIDLLGGIEKDLITDQIPLERGGPPGIKLKQFQPFIDEATKDGEDWPMFYRLTFDALARANGLQGRDVFIDKMPAYSGSLLSHVYPRMPGVPVIAMVRDPRAVYCSWRKRRPQDLLEAVGRYVMLMHGILNALNADKPVLLVQFEDLVRFPEVNMQRVAWFLGLGYDPAMLSPANSYAQHIKTRFGFPPWDENLRKPRPAALDRTAIDEWQELLSPYEADAIVAAIPGDLRWTLAGSGEKLPGHKT